MEVEGAKLIEDLARPYRAATAIRIFMSRGASAIPALVKGLQHPDAEARYQCCRLLDQLLTADAMEPLLAMLDDPDARVRASALHSLSCDRCKTEVCLPTDGPLLKKAIQLLDSDPDAHVRAMAIEAVGRSVHADPTAEAAILRTVAVDPSPAVRKKARWYAPGGKIHERSKRPTLRAGSADQIGAGPGEGSVIAVSADDATGTRASCSQAGRSSRSLR